LATKEVLTAPLLYIRGKRSQSSFKMRVTGDCLTAILTFRYRPAASRIASSVLAEASLYLCRESCRESCRVRLPTAEEPELANVQILPLVVTVPKRDEYHARDDSFSWAVHECSWDMIRHHRRSRSGNLQSHRGSIWLPTSFQALCKSRNRQRESRKMTWPDHVPPTRSSFSGTCPEDPTRK